MIILRTVLQSRTRYRINEMTAYFTTPIYYVNDAPHIGHAYTTILGDVLSRYHRLFGEDGYFLTGTDEHGQKVQSSAEARGLTPQAHCDEFVQRFQEIWKELNIQNDDFIRTTFDFHKEVVRKCLQELYDKDEIYEDEYEGWYSVSEEMFYAEDELIDGKSPLGKEVVKIKEKNYFFKMSKYQERLISHIEANPDFIMPKGKRSEVLGFLKKPLEDLCISRPKSRISWGIELPFDTEFVTYVWFDALLNYVTAVGYKQTGEKSELYERYWPYVTHLIGKDILTTHCVYWPTMLMALEISLPKRIFAHGWWLNQDDRKMSKSEGEVVSPLDMKNIVGVDCLRYFLMRAMNPANDGQFSKELVLSRVNTDLANNLGNLLNRTVGLIDKHFDGQVPRTAPANAITKELATVAIKVADQVEESIREIAPHRALENIFSLLNETNRYLDELEPWKVVKGENKDDAKESLYAALESLRIAGILLSPVMPTKMKELLDRIGWNKAADFQDAKRWGLLSEESSVVKAAGLFPRVE